MGDRAESSKSVMLEHQVKEESKAKRLKIAEEEKEMKKIKLQTADGVIFEVEPSTVKDMKTVQTFIEDNDNGMDGSSVVPLFNVSSKNLRRIIELKVNKGLLKMLSPEEVKELILAADYLNMKSLLDLLTKTLADMIQNKSIEFLTNFFGVVNDFTPEEEAKIRQEYQWAFHGWVPDD